MWALHLEAAGHNLASVLEDLGLVDAREVARPGRPDGRLQQLLAG